MVINGVNRAISCFGDAGAGSDVDGLDQLAGLFVDPSDLAFACECRAVVFEMLR